MQIGNKEVEVILSLFADDKILYIKMRGKCYLKLVELTNEFSKFSGYKMNIQNTLHIYTLTIKQHKEKLGKQPCLQSYKKKSRNKSKEINDMYSEVNKTN